MSASEIICRQFAGEFNTTNVKRAIALCEAGTLAWEEVEVLFTSSLSDGLAAVKAAR